MTLLTTETRARPAISDRPLLSYVEQYECPRCESRIPQDLVKRHDPTGDEIASNLRRISVWCPACRTGFTGLFRFAGGVLQPASAVELVPDATDLADVIRQFERVRGAMWIPAREPTLPSEPALPNEPTAGAQESHLLSLAESRRLQFGRAYGGDVDAYTEQQRRIDREFEQRSAWDETEPGRDFVD